MDSSSIDLPGSEISAIQLEGQQLRITFSRAYIIQTMTGSVERTKWWQTGDLVLDDVEIEDSLPGAGPWNCQGGDIYNNVYTYRDMIPLPLATRGRVGCKLRLEGLAAPLKANGSALRLEMREVPKYLEHLRPSTP